MSLKRVLLAFCAVLLCQGSSRATTLLVNPDGTGDVPTIQAAVDAAVTGDVILLGDGVFQGPGNWDIECQGKAIEIRSGSDDPAACIIDCEDSSGHRGFVFQNVPSPGANLRGVTITNARTGYGGGGVRTLHSIVTFQKCVFRNSRDESGSYGGGWGGGGVGCGSSCTASFFNCVFEDNWATGGGAFAGTGESELLFERCVFARNVASAGGGACSLDVLAVAHFAECLFDGNEAPAAGAVGCVFEGRADFERCTMVGNSASDRGSCFMAATDGMGTFSHSVLAFNEGVSAVWLETSTEAELSCCDIYGNAGGDWANGIEEQFGIMGNVSLDPLFCDVDAHDYGLQEGSPCAPGEVGCGQIGAFGVGCSGTPTRESSWGRIKEMFRHSQ
jgi:hypothetical protein